jgi:hypothetical protein
MGKQILLMVARLDSRVLAMEIMLLIRVVAIAPESDRKVRDCHADYPRRSSEQVSNRIDRDPLKHQELLSAKPVHQPSPSVPLVLSPT